MSEYNNFNNNNNHNNTNFNSSGMSSFKNTNSNNTNTNNMNNNFNNTGKINNSDYTNNNNKNNNFMNSNMEDYNNVEDEEEEEYNELNNNKMNNMNNNEDSPDNLPENQLVNLIDNNNQLNQSNLINTNSQSNNNSNNTNTKNPELENYIEQLQSKIRLQAQRLFEYQTNKYTSKQIENVKDDNKALKAKIQELKSNNENLQIDNIRLTKQKHNTETRFHIYKSESLPKNIINSVCLAKSAGKPNKNSNNSNKTNFNSKPIKLQDFPSSDKISNENMRDAYNNLLINYSTLYTDKENILALLREETIHSEEQKTQIEIFKQTLEGKLYKDKDLLNIIKNNRKYYSKTLTDLDILLDVNKLLESNEALSKEVFMADTLIEELKQEIDFLRIQNNELLYKKDKIKDNLIKAMKDFEELKNFLENTEKNKDLYMKNYENLNITYNKLVNEYDDILEKVEFYEGRANEANPLFKELNYLRQKEEKYEDYDEIVLLNNTMKGDIENYTTNNTKYKESIKQKNEEITNLLNEKSDLIKEYAEFEKNKQYILNLNNKYLITNKELEIKSKSLNEEKAILVQEIELIQNKNNTNNISKEEQVEKLIKEIKVHKLELDEYKNRNNKEDIYKNSILKKNADLNNTIVELNTKLVKDNNISSLIQEKDKYIEFIEQENHEFKMNTNKILEKENGHKKIVYSIVNKIKNISYYYVKAYQTSNNTKNLKDKIVNLDKTENYNIELINEQFKCIEEIVKDLIKENDTLKSSIVEVENVEILKENNKVINEKLKLKNEEYDKIELVIRDYNKDFSFIENALRRIIGSCDSISSDVNYIYNNTNTNNNSNNNTSQEILNLISLIESLVKILLSGESKQIHNYKERMTRIESHNTNNIIQIDSKDDYIKEQKTIIERLEEKIANYTSTIKDIIKSYRTKLESTGINSDINLSNSNLPNSLEKLLEIYHDQIISVNQANNKYVLFNNQQKDILINEEKEVTQTIKEYDMKVKHLESILGQKNNMIERLEKEIMDNKIGEKKASNNFNNHNITNNNPNIPKREVEDIFNAVFSYVENYYISVIREKKSNQSNNVILNKNMKEIMRIIKSSSSTSNTSNNNTNNSISISENYSMLKSIIKHLLIDYTDHEELKTTTDKTDKELKSYKSDNKKLYDEYKRLNSIIDSTGKSSNSSNEKKLNFLTKQNTLLDILLNKLLTYNSNIELASVVNTIIAENAKLENELINTGNPNSLNLNPNNNSKIIELKRNIRNNEALLETHFTKSHNYSSKYSRNRNSNSNNNMSSNSNNTPNNNMSSNSNSNNNKIGNIN